jgi:hypothetical protein
MSLPSAQSRVGLVLEFVLAILGALGLGVSIAIAVILDLLVMVIVDDQRRGLGV